MHKYIDTFSAHGLAFRCAMALLASSVFFDAMAEDISWSTQNRSLEFAFGGYKQKYRETDVLGMTATGVFDSESGILDEIEARIQWQTDADLWVQTSVKRISGQTDYDGHIQSGATLTPVKGKTGNVLHQGDFRFGYALNSARIPFISSSLQIIPLVQWGRHTWNRDLAQYNERYSFDVHGFGVAAQWRARPETMLEAQYVSGVVGGARVVVDAYNFDAVQPGGSFTEVQFSLAQDLRSMTGHSWLNGWHGVVRFSETQYAHGQSPVVNGLQAPPSDANPLQISIGIKKNF